MSPKIFMPLWMAIKRKNENERESLLYDRFYRREKSTPKKYKGKYKGRYLLGLRVAKIRRKWIKAK